MPANEKGAFMPFDFKKEYKDLYLPKRKASVVEVPPMTFFAVAGTGDPNEPDGAYSKALELLYGLSYTVKMSKMGAWQPEGYFDYVVPPLEGLWWAGVGAFDGASIADKNALSWVSLIRQPDFVTSEVFVWVCAELAKKKPALAEACEPALGGHAEGVPRLVRFAEGPCVQIMHCGPYDDAELAKKKPALAEACEPALGGHAEGVPRLVRFAEGPCVQIMHCGPYDDEPETIAKLTAYTQDEKLICDIAEGGESPEGHAATGAFDAAAVLAALDANGAVPTVRLHHEIYLGDPRRTRPENLKTVIRHPVRRA